MSERACEETRRRLALGEDGAGPGLREHLDACAPCRGEAERLAGLLGLLAEGAEVEPSPAVDHRVRESILARPARSRWELNPAIATGLAAGSSLALFSAAAGALAEGTGLAPALAVLIAYFALSFAATLPLLMRARTAGARQNGEVRI